MSDRIRGKVKFFNSEKGFGFITPDDGSEDVFLHVSALKDAYYDDIEDDAAIEFEREIGNNGKTKAGKIDVLN